MRLFTVPADLAAAAGEHLGASAWHEVTQRRVDRFAEVSGDRQWIHTDPERARSGIFGGTVVHGMLTASLVPPLLDEIFQVGRCDLIVNKGMDRLRFRSPVPVGAKVRVLADLREAVLRPRGFTEAVIAVALEVESRRGPVCTADQRLLFHTPDR
ncbi:MaoC family dehydratase [Actinocorallia lasiicapitis]